MTERVVLYEVVGMILDEPAPLCPLGGHAADRAYFREAKADNPKRPWVPAPWTFCSTCGRIRPFPISRDYDRGACPTFGHHEWRALRYRPGTGHRNYFELPPPKGHEGCVYCFREGKDDGPEWERYYGRMHGWWFCVRCGGIYYGGRYD